ncbi:MAG TPA: pyruvate formate-lyase-activating protein [Sphingobium sp.]|nr:pyruvate formate-lyase-activating protein [Sphingobium sp.]
MGAPSSAPLYGCDPYQLRLDQSKSVSEDEARAALKRGDIGFLHSFTTGSVVDGPGVRLVAWTTACMFRCRYCHNPDTWTLSNGMPVSIERARDELRKYAPGLKAMRGGFTLSGGEPLMQARFAAKLFGVAKALGIHTAIETNGYSGEKLTDQELTDIDLVILDMKAFSPEQHNRVTGVTDNAGIFDFCRRLALLRRPMWLRYVLVPGLTDVPDEIAAVAEFAASLGVVERAEILPFHQLGRYKWDKLQLGYALSLTSPPTQSAVDEAVGIFRARGLDTN